MLVKLGEATFLLLQTQGGRALEIFQSFVYLFVFARNFFFSERLLSEQRDLELCGFC